VGAEIQGATGDDKRAWRAPADRNTPAGAADILTGSGSVSRFMSDAVHIRLTRHRETMRRKGDAGRGLLEKFPDRFSDAYRNLAFHEMFEMLISR
jgi:hypothetical protein